MTRGNLFWLHLFSLVGTGLAVIDEKTGVNGTDKLKDCKLWAANGRCNTDKWVKRSCVKSCKIFEICGAAALQPQRVPCLDKLNDCKTWADKGRCKTDTWVYNNCLKSCGRFDICAVIPLKPLDGKEEEEQGNKQKGNENKKTQEEQGEGKETHREKEEEEKETQKEKEEEEKETQEEKEEEEKETQEEKRVEKSSGYDKYYPLVIIVMAIIIAILLGLVVYFFGQNRALKAALNAKTELGNIELETKQEHHCTKDIEISNVVYEDPENIEKIANERTLFQDMENNEATYTALDRTRKNDDEDHYYVHYK